LGFLNAQITFETQYEHSGTYTKLAISGYKFYVMDVGQSQCRIYNTNHSLWKTINLSVPANNYLYDIKYVSENLFTTDNSLCLSYVYYYYDAVNDYYTFTAKVVKENGTELLSIPGAEYLYVHSLEGIGTKMVAYVYDYSLLYYTIKSRIYDLPGELLSAAGSEIDPTIQLQNPYPNPAGDFTNVPYQLPEGQFEGTLTITDINGKIKDIFRIDRNFPSLHLDTSEYPKGLYLYQVSSGNYTSGTQKLVVQ
jgi:hypothetical protein